MPTVTSKDGTTIAYDKVGQGSAVILIEGAMGSRAASAELANLLTPNFTVYAYDRRGRGESTDTKPYAVQADRRADAAALFMKFVGVPDEMIEGMRQGSMWHAMERVAPTLIYDAAVLGEDRTVPTSRVSC
jgi:pimeloyl-ACP methyl ester carboxylesterase